MRTTARLAMISQVLGGSFVAIAFFGFLWMNIPGGGGWIPVFAIVFCRDARGRSTEGHHSSRSAV